VDALLSETGRGRVSATPKADISKELAVAVGLWK
jgi:hypothetical protein